MNRITLPKDWYERYLGVPWAAVPNPPESYNCGELCRTALRDWTGIDAPMIAVPDASILRDTLKAMRPELYDLVPVSEPQSLDIVWMCRRIMFDHVGIGVETAEGLLVMHCRPGGDVHLDSPTTLLHTGFSELRWYRHRELIHA